MKKEFSLYRKGQRLITRVRFAILIRKVIDILSATDISGREEGDIIIANTRGSKFFLFVESVIAYVLSRLGYKVYICIDDGILHHYDTYKAIDYFDNPSAMTPAEFSRLISRKTQRGPQSLKRRILSSLKRPIDQRLSPIALVKQWLSKIDNISVIYFSSVVPENYQTDQHFLTALSALTDGKLSPHVEASHRRCFGGRPFDPKNELHMTYAQASTRNEYIVRKVGEYVLNKLEPVLYISLDGNYSIAGPLRDLMKAYNIPVVVYRPDGFHDRTIYIGDSPYLIYNVSDHWKYFIDNDYDSALRKKACGFLDLRVDLDSYKPNEFDIKWVDRIKSVRDDYEKVIALFPNLTWDGAIKERDVLFNSLEDWLKKTIDWSKNNRILLIIREHPQPPDVYHPFQSSISLLTEIYPEALTYDNVYFIRGTEYLSSYFLISEVVDCAVTYGGTLSIEVPYMGFPTVLAANSPYSNKTLAFEPRNEREYFRYLSQLDRSSEEFVENRDRFKKNAIKAAAYQFFYNIYYFPIMPSNSDWQEFKYTTEKYWQSWDIKSLDVTQNSDFKRTINRFLLPLNNSIT